MKPRVILGIGKGQCGLRFLAKVLSNHPGAKMSCEEPPLLPWQIAAGQPEREPKKRGHP